MADPVQSETDYFDCSSLSISYAPTGLATISFTVYRDRSSGAPYQLGGPGFEINAGGVLFKGWVQEQSLVPASDVKMSEWRVTAIAIGCPGDGLGTEC
jgi:hypothetical protein